MTELDDFARELYAAAPSLPGAMRAAGESAEPDNEIRVLWLGDLGEALASEIAKDGSSSFVRAFQVIEHWMMNASAGMQEAIATGLLEALASRVSGGRLEPAVLAELLGAESRRYVDAWDEYSLGRSSLKGL